MASSFGIAVTNITSRLGILSRKACIRLATETGEKAIVKRAELGRNLNKQEVEQLFAEVLPKRCRPKVITTDSEVYECLKRSGFNDEQIAKQIHSGEDMAMTAANVGNGTGKMAYWIPYERHAQIKDPFLKQYIETNFNALIAHEMEHSLEKNCRIKDIIRRKTQKIRIALFKLFDKNFMEKLNQRQIAVHQFEADMQKLLASTAEIDRTAGTIKFKCKPTVEDISAFFTKTEGVSLEDKLRGFIRGHYASAENKGSETNKRLKLLKYFMDMEHPAYEVTGQIERRITGLKEGEYALNEMVAKGYEAAIDVAKQERRTYWKNKLLGRLKKPNIYLSDKDILRHAANKEEKQILTDLIKDMTVDQKKRFIKVLSSFEGQPNAIKNLAHFTEATKVDGKLTWVKDLVCLKGIDLELLARPEIIKIAKITDVAGYPVYRFSLKDIASAKPEAIREFAKIADKKDVIVRGCDGEVKANFLGAKKVTTRKSISSSYRYQSLGSQLENPNYKELKELCDIEVNGEYPYQYIVNGIVHLSPERIKANLEAAKNAAKEGKSIYLDICHEIDEACGLTKVSA